MRRILGRPPLLVRLASHCHRCTGSCPKDDSTSKDTHRDKQRRWCNTTDTNRASQRLEMGHKLTLDLLRRLQLWQYLGLASSPCWQQLPCFSGSKHSKASPTEWPQRPSKHEPRFAPVLNFSELSVLAHVRRQAGRNMWTRSDGSLDDPIRNNLTVLVLVPGATQHALRAIAYGAYAFLGPPAHIPKHTSLTSEKSVHPTGNEVTSVSMGTPGGGKKVTATSKVSTSCKACKQARRRRRRERFRKHKKKHGHRMIINRPRRS